MFVVSPDTTRLLDWAVRKSRRSFAPISSDFIRKQGEAPPLLAGVIRGGRGGEARLKLYLSMNLLAVKKPHDLREIPARVWAEMLGLPKPETNGARRIAEATLWLGKAGLISIAGRTPGKPLSISLLDQSGSGRPYSRPSRRYVNIPVQFWLNRWIVLLSGRAIALLLILLDHQRGRDDPEGVWIRPTDAKGHYDLSPDTWTRGVKELKDCGLVKVTESVAGDVWDWKRRRNKYFVNISRLDDEAPI